MNECFETRVLAKLVHSVIMLVLTSFIILYTGNSQAEDARVLLDRYAELRLRHSNDNELAEPLRSLLSQVETYRDANPEDPLAWLASARVRFGYANTQGPVKGMQLISETRDEIEMSISLNPNADRAYGLAFLGYLYAAMPRWPISFGNDEKGWEYMNRALVIDSESVANQYFLTTLLIADKRFEEAEKVLVSAKLIAESSGNTTNMMDFWAQNLQILEGQLFRVKPN